jgi:gamma-glutamyltranspeptidase/glutathione hydrolase
MFEQATVDALEARGHVLRQIDMTSGLQAVEQLQPNAGAPRIRAGADPRREGLVMGD